MHTLLHIYGPFAIHSYGLAIALGLLLFCYMIQRDPRFTQLHLENKFTSILLVAILSALIGGRALFLSNYPELYTNIFDFVTFWQPGFSILGAILSVVILLPLYLTLVHVPVLGFLDLVAIYAPLLQSISRIGCFFAGCCFGMQTSEPWGVVYTDVQSAAPLHTCIHPTQLYSAFGLLIIFALMYCIFQHIFKKPGQLTCLYLMCTSTERFMVDFWRGDRIITETFFQFSSYQYIAAGIALGSAIIFLWSLMQKS